MLILFFGLTHHQWIKEDKYLLNSIKELFKLLPAHVQKFLVQENVLFIKCNKKFSSAVNLPPKAKGILIFPDLSQMLCSGAPEFGWAILAHEIGHLISKHSLKRQDPLISQIEADKFAVNIGLGAELADFLQNLPRTQEISVRLSYLTAELATIGYFDR